MTLTATDYAFAPGDAEALMGVTLLPGDLREQALAKIARERGRDALVALFAQFMGLANAVVENNREQIELFLVAEAGFHPNTAEKINLPTVFGALAGVKLAAGVDPAKLCHGCAFRLGSVANQSPSTTCDADWCAHPGEDPFFCHEGLDDEEKPTQGCRGFAQARRLRTVAEARV